MKEKGQGKIEKYIYFGDGRKSVTFFRRFHVSSAGPSD